MVHAALPTTSFKHSSDLVSISFIVMQIPKKCYDESIVIDGPVPPNTLKKGTKLCEARPWCMKSKLRVKQLFRKC